MLEIKTGADYKKNYAKPMAIVSLLAMAVLVIICLSVNVYGWSGQNGVMRYMDKYGQPVLNWQMIDGKTYYFLPETGEMVTGWKAIDKDLFYFDESGVRVCGWLEQDAKKYYLDEEGKMVKGWYTVQEQRYYFTPDGNMVTGSKMIDGKQYYFDAQGRMITGWQKIQSEKYFFTEEGQAHIGLLALGEKTYYFDKDGKMQTGWLTQGQERYYFLEDGVMAVGEVKIDGISTYFTSKGKYMMLVNPWVSVPDDYEVDLVNIEGHRFDRNARDFLQAMMDACRDAGHVCKINNTYRSRSVQQRMWNNSISRKIAAGMTYEEAEIEAGKTLARPGYSEHETGLAVDILGTDAMYDWLEKNCWDYGFVLRYPDNRYEITGITYEPWHFRYVGTELSLEMKGKDISLEEYMIALTQQAEQ